MSMKLRTGTKLSSWLNPDLYHTFSAFLDFTGSGYKLDPTPVVLVCALPSSGPSSVAVRVGPALQWDVWIMRD